MLNEQEIKNLISKYENYANNVDLTTEQRNMYRAMVNVLEKVLE